MVAVIEKWTVRGNIHTSLSDEEVVRFKVLEPVAVFDKLDEIAAFVLWTFRCAIFSFWSAIEFANSNRVAYDMDS